MSDLVVTHNAGITSCLSVRLDEIVQFRVRTGQWPSSVDSTQQFRFYWARWDGPIDARLLRPIPTGLPELAPPLFNHNHQYIEYTDLDPRIFPVALHYSYPSAEVEEIAAEIAERMTGRTFVHYRGNDKTKERPRVSYDAMFAAARKLGGPYWVLTDEEEFRAAFYATFPNSDHLRYLPAIKRNENAFVTGLRMDRPLFAVRFLAALYASRKAEKLAVTTGNTALWAVLWRGHAEGVLQMNTAREWLTT